MDVGNPGNVWIFRMHKAVGVVNDRAQFPAVADQLFGGIIFNAAEIFLRIDNGVKIASVSHVKFNPSQ